MLTYNLPSHLGLSKEEILQQFQGGRDVTPEVLADIIEQNNQKLFHQLSLTISQINDNLRQLDSQK